MANAKTGGVVVLREIGRTLMGVEGLKDANGRQMQSRNWGLKMGCRYK